MDTNLAPPPLRKPSRYGWVTAVLATLLAITSACQAASDLVNPGARPATTLPAVVETPFSMLPASQATPPIALPFEVPVVSIPLEGHAALNQAEYSGMAWHQDDLILLPQYPQRMSEQPGGVLFAIPRQALLDFIQGKTSQPIQPREIRLISEGLEKKVPQFEGFEAIAFKDERVYLSIEAREGLKMIGYLVSGTINTAADEITLKLDTLTKNPLQRQQSNRSDEAILIADNQVITFFESNGAQANPDSHATVFDLNLQRMGALEFPAVEYRLTDATEMDTSGRFWMMNYFYPGDSDLLPTSDPIREKFGAGATHTQSEAVERLLEFEYSPEGISLSGSAPIPLELLPGDESRNWEGLVRLEDLGFLVVTDKFPSTILGFIAYP